MFGQVAVIQVSSQEVRRGMGDSKNDVLLDGRREMVRTSRFLPSEELHVLTVSMKTVGVTLWLCLLFLFQNVAD